MPKKRTKSERRKASLRKSSTNKTQEEQSNKKDNSSSSKSLSKAEADEHGMKRLFVCCDGTWMNATGSIAPPTNVARLARSIDRHGNDRTQLPVPQVAYYAGGVGTTSVLPPFDYYYAGVTGAGLTKSILDAYCFLCNNYNFRSKKDEIILVGFSRGAFAVRCLASFITKIGLIRRKYLSLLPNAFESWCQKQGEIADMYKDEHIAYKVRIKVLAEWDPVSALWNQGFKFVKDKVPGAVINAFIAIAMDEWRSSFQPMLWTKREDVNNTKKVEQCLFTGYHTDIGGGNADAGLSTIALLWMISQIQTVSDAAFDEGALLQAILPLPPSIETGGKLRYESLLQSKGYVNPPPWWWLFGNYRTFSRHQQLSDVAGEDSHLNDTLKVHFTVPLLGEGAAKNYTEDNSMPRAVELWNGFKLPWQDPNPKEIRLWGKWKTQAEIWKTESKTWKPNNKDEAKRPNHKDDTEEEIKEWGAVITGIGMQAVPGRPEESVVSRVNLEIPKKSRDLCRLFELSFKEKKTE